MTAVATIFALLPMALGTTGGGVFISQPLDIAVIGSLILSTALTLIGVPVLYELIEGLRGRRRERWTPIEPAPDPEVEPRRVGRWSADVLGLPVLGRAQAGSAASSHRLFVRISPPSRSAWRCSRSSAST